MFFPSQTGLIIATFRHDLDNLFKDAYYDALYNPFFVYNRLMPPIIGITTSEEVNSNGFPVVRLNRAYVDAVQGAGGVPVLIPSSLAKNGWEALYLHLDGVLFAGGGDIAIERFGGQPHPKVDLVDLPRDAVELDLLEAVRSDGKPFLGICRGCQLLNVGLGGTLYTHIADQMPGALQHCLSDDQHHVLVHEVRIEEGTLAAQVFGEPILKVNSHHHQGIKDLADGLRVAGRSPDGLVEAVELPDHPFGLAVQWHPEWLTDQLVTRQLFQAFVDASSKDGHKSPRNFH